MADPAAVSAATKVQQHKDKTWMTTWIRETIHDLSQWKAADKPTQKAMDSIASAHMYKWLAETRIWDEHRLEQDPNNGPRPREHDASTEALKLALDLPDVPDLVKAIETLRIHKPASTLAAQKKARTSRKMARARALRKKAAPVAASRRSTRLTRTKTPRASTPAVPRQSRRIGTVVKFRPSPEPIKHKITVPCLSPSSPKVATSIAKVIESTPLSSPIANSIQGSEVSDPVFSRVFTPPPPHQLPARSPSGSPSADLAYDSDATEVASTPTRRNKRARSQSPPLLEEITGSTNADDSPPRYRQHESIHEYDSAEPLLAPTAPRPSPARSQSPPLLEEITGSTNADDSLPRYHQHESIHEYDSAESLPAPTAQRPSPASFLMDSYISSALVLSKQTRAYVSPYGPIPTPSIQGAASSSLPLMHTFYPPRDLGGAARISTTPAGSMRVPSPHRPPPPPFSPSRSPRSVYLASLVSPTPSPPANQATGNVATSASPGGHASIEPWPLYAELSSPDPYDNSEERPRPNDQKKKRAEPSHDTIVISSDEEEEEVPRKRVKKGGMRREGAF